MPITAFTSLGKAGAGEQRCFAASRNAEDGDVIGVDLRLAMEPLECMLEVLERNPEQLVWKAGQLEVTEREHRIAAGGQRGACQRAGEPADGTRSAPRSLDGAARPRGK